MRIMRIIIIFSVILMLSGCIDSSKSKFQQVLDSAVSKGSLEHYDYVIIIPQEGCDGCITFAEEFYNSYNHLPNILYVFTHIISEKSLKRRVNLTPETILDKENEFGAAYPDKQRLYPCLLTLKNGLVQTVSYQSPDGNALIDLEELIENN